MRGKLRYTTRVPEHYRITPAGAGKTNSAFPSKHNIKDHPRRCGENNLRTYIWIHAEGSPPQVRGKPRGQIQPKRAIWDHPRRCGENLPFWVFWLRQMGSPPQVRGKRLTIAATLNPRRITPADAGKTTTPYEWLPAYKDHPRGCGENYNSKKFVTSSCGSPPRMRGKQ